MRLAGVWPAVDVAHPRGWAEAALAWYLIGYGFGMEVAVILVRARRAAGLSQAALAEAAGTSRSTLSAYEHGRKSPTLQTASRILAAVGSELTGTPRVEFGEAAVERGRPILAPTALPRLTLEQALVSVELSLHWN